MVTRLRAINPIQFALVMGLLYAILGLIFAVIWLPFGALMSAIPGAGRMMGAGLGVAALILFPIFYFVLMFVFGLITAALYNLVAAWTGGIEVTLEQPVTAGAATGGYTT